MAFEEFRIFRIWVDIPEYNEDAMLTTSYPLWIGHYANGDFITQQFTHSMREHLDDTTNAGFYLKAQGGDESKFLLQISPGKAYVKGYEIDKIGTTNLSLPKARTTQSISGAKTPTRLGNYIKAENCFGFPDFGNEAGAQALDPHGVCKLYPTTASGSPQPTFSGDHIALEWTSYRRAIFCCK